MPDPFEANVFALPETGLTNTCPNNDPSCYQKYDDGCGNEISCQNWCLNFGTVAASGTLRGYTAFGGKFCLGTPKWSWATCIRTTDRIDSHEWNCQ